MMQGPGRVQAGSRQVPDVLPCLKEQVDNVIAVVRDIGVLAVRCRGTEPGLATLQVLELGQTLHGVLVADCSRSSRWHAMWQK